MPRPSNIECLAHGHAYTLVDVPRVSFDTEVVLTSVMAPESKILHSAYLCPVK